MTPDQYQRAAVRRPASIKDVAAAAGVSATTVSHVLSGNRPVNEHTAARVRSVVNRLGYVPASLARSLQAGSTSVIGLLIPDISNTVHKPIANHVPMIPTAGSAQVKSPSQARVTPSSPTADKP